MTRDDDIESQNGLEALGLDSGATAGNPASNAASAPFMTRRQMRELEQRGQVPEVPRPATPVAPSVVPSYEMDTQAITPAELGFLMPEAVAPTAEAAPTTQSIPVHPAAESRAEFPRRARGEGRGPRKRDSARRGRALAASRPAGSRPADTRQSHAARISSKLFSMGAMLFAGALIVGVSVPASAFIVEEVPDTTVQSSALSMAKQSLAVSADVAAAATARDSFTVTSYADLLKAKYGNRSYDYNVTSGAIRWPFPYAVPISSGFGDRVAPCRGCSSSHNGLDFNPGEGAPIYAIADGIVSFTEVSNYGFGNHVFLTHTIGGQKVETVYAHMQMNSIVVATGQEVKAGDLIGLVGSTGQSTGAHLHFEVRLSGVPVDPFAWLKANAVN